MRPKLVMIHGLGRTFRCFRKAARFFSEDYDVRYWDYPSTTANMDYLVGELDLLVEPGMRFLTHSMGGIILRRLAAERSLPGCRAVLLAPPNRGSDIIDLLKSSEITRTLGSIFLGEAGMSLSTDLRIPPAVDLKYGVVAACGLAPMDVLMSGVSDGKVSVASASSSEDHAGIRVVNCTHTTIMKNREALLMAGAFLRNGTFGKGEKKYV